MADTIVADLCQHYDLTARREAQPSARDAANVAPPLAALLVRRRRRPRRPVFIPISSTGGGAAARGLSATTGSTAGKTTDTGFSIAARNVRPAGVICQPAASRVTKPWLKMFRSGARAAMRFVRSVQSRPLDIKMATSRRRSASGTRPPDDPANTFRTVIWKLTPVTPPTAPNLQVVPWSSLW
jgi:hypothetical protein